MVEEMVLTTRWDENLLKGGHRLAIRTDEGFLPFEVIDHDVVDLNLYWTELYDTIPAGTLSVVGGTSGTPPSLIPGVYNWTIPRNADGFEYLYIEEKRNLIAQIFMGISDPDIKVWYRYPMGATRKHLQNPLGANSFYPALATTKYYGWLVNGEESTFEAPTTRGEFYQLPQQSLEFGIMNNSTREIDLVLRFIINYLKVEPLDKSKPEDMEIIKAMLTHKIPAKVWSPGLEAFHYGLANKNFGIQPVRAVEVGLHE